MSDAQSVFTNISGQDGQTVDVLFEGKPLQLRHGVSVAAALLEAGVRHFRDTPTNAAPRAPFCMMGVCFDCLMVIDGLANQQACMVRVSEGMTIARQSNLSGPVLNAPDITKMHP